ncbi:MAG: hypothetical protein JNM27_03415 [Leptospirales bacterium]|nr:hypothetical protein [Leptospirales bacterium]
MKNPFKKLYAATLVLTLSVMLQCHRKPGSWMHPEEIEILEANLTTEQAMRSLFGNYSDGYSSWTADNPTAIGLAPGAGPLMNSTVIATDVSRANSVTFFIETKASSETPRSRPDRIVTEAKFLRKEGIWKVALWQKATPFQGRWAGEWQRDERFQGASLRIEQFLPGSIIISMMAYNGGHSGFVEGEAPIVGEKALYSHDPYSSFDEKCLIELRPVGSEKFEVTQKSGLCGAAIGVGFSGTYWNIKIKRPPENLSLVSDGLLSEENDVAFRKLVGSDYQLFTNCSQQIMNGPDLDGLEADVSTTGVRGLYTMLESIVMINKKQNIWAAVIDGSSVKYFTNREDFKTKLPATIEKWRERFPDMQVIYMNK